MPNSTICQTHIPVFLKKLVHGNSKIKILHRKRGRGQADKGANGKKWSRRKKIKSCQPNYSLSLQSPWGCYSLKQWINYLTNLTYSPTPITFKQPGIENTNPEQLKTNMNFDNLPMAVVDNLLMVWTWGIALPKYCIF